MLNIIDKYLKDLENCFFINIDGFNKSELDIFFKDKPDLIKGIHEKELYRNNWNILIKCLNDNLSFRFRNMEIFGQRHSYNGLLSFNSDNNSIIFSISFPFKLIAFRYSKFMMNLYTKKNEELLSYSEIDNETSIAKEILINLINLYFPNFNIFNNNYADYIIESIIIDGVKHEKINLWNALFSTNNHGTI